MVILHGATAGHQAPVGSMSASSSVSSPSPKPTASTTAQPSSTVTAPQSSNTVASPSGAGTDAVVALNPTSTGSPTDTASVVIRPVDQAGQPAPGYTVNDLTKDPGNLSNNCGSVGKSFPAAVNANIMWCSPSAPSVAFACWEAATPTHALCMQDPWSSKLTEWTSSVTTTTAPGQPLPLGLLLSDGDHCRIRPGDFQGGPAQQPTQFGYYACTQDGAIWGPGKDANNTPWQALGTHGIDRSTPMWTVQVGSIDGPLSVRRVITAHYLGTRGS